MSCPEEVCGEAIVSAATAREPGAIERMLGVHAFYGGEDLIGDVGPVQHLSLPCPLRQCENARYIIVTGSRVFRVNGNDQPCRAQLIHGSSDETGC